jgi:hypothetical protein
MVKFLKDIVLAASLALGLNAACHIEDTKPLKKDYTYVTNDRIKELEEKFCDDFENNRRIVQDASDFETDSEDQYRHPDREVSQFFGTHNQEIVNRVEEMAVEDHESKGYSRNIISKIKLGIKPPRKVKAICGSKASACNFADYITMPDDYNNSGFIDTIFHEMGHSLNWGNMEFGSISNEAYMVFKTYQFSKAIGSLMMMHLYDYISPDVATTEKPFPLMYNRGMIYAISNFAEHNADLEEAMNHVTQNKHLILETDLEQKLNSMEGNSSDKYFTIWNDFLDKGNLISELSKRITLTEANELKDFLKIINHSALLADLTNADEIREEYLRLSKNFIFNPNYTNPLFRAIVTFDITPSLISDIYQISWDKGYGSNEHFQFTKRVVDINQPYPCYEKNPYRCPPRMRIKRDDHARLYHILIDSAFNGNEITNRPIAIPYLVNFIEKFYPGTNFEEGNFQAIEEANKIYDNILPYLVYQIGKYEYIHGDKERAKKFWDAALKINCNSNGIMVHESFCEVSKDYIQTLKDNNP